MSNNNEIRYSNVVTSPNNDNDKYNDKDHRNQDGQQSLHEIQWTPVFLNVYHLHRFNRYLDCLGLGAYHSGVEIFDKEFTFGYHAYSHTGVFFTQPKSAVGEFRSSHFCGHVALDLNEFIQLIENLKLDYPGNSYNLLTKNCNTFCFELLQKLKLPSPRYTNRLGSFAYKIRCCIPRKFICLPDQIEEMEYQERQRSESRNRKPPPRSSRSSSSFNNDSNNNNNQNEQDEGASTSLIYTANRAPNRESYDSNSKKKIMQMPEQEDSSQIHSTSPINTNNSNTAYHYQAFNDFIQFSSPSSSLPQPQPYPHHSHNPYPGDDPHIHFDQVEVESIAVRQH